ncbi:MAG: hypothetical protein C0623_04960 [Desulfuromonas sp.]|nr:MAG: hypothetical protein C0623_04960 [Desulfuromonas sp.]
MTQPLAENYFFWTPEPGKIVPVGPGQEPVTLPEIRLPIKSELCVDGQPSDDAIGTSIYDYLRQFPDCEHNVTYAEILRDAYPHYLADLGSQIVMLDHKDVEVPYIKRKLVRMRILLLLDPDNHGLKMQLGVNYYELGLMFPELPYCRDHFTRALRYLSDLGDDAAALNYLARIDYLMGDLPKAIERWQKVSSIVDDPATRSAIDAQVETLQQMEPPDRPLIEGLEAIGEAMQLMAAGGHEQAKMIFEAIEEENIIPQQFPNPEFYYMLGVCREKTGDVAGAFSSYSNALDLDSDHAPSHEGLDRVTGGIN